MHARIIPTTRISAGISTIKRSRKPDTQSHTFRAARDNCIPVPHVQLQAMASHRSAPPSASTLAYKVKPVVNVNAWLDSESSTSVGTSACELDVPSFEPYSSDNSDTSITQPLRRHVRTKRRPHASKVGGSHGKGGIRKHSER